MTRQDYDMTDVTAHSGPSPARVTVDDAAKLLGVSIDAIRKRIERGTLESEKVDGTRYVFLDTDRTRQDDGQGQRHVGDQTDPDTDMTPTPLLASMQDQIDTLKQELEDWKEEARRKDAILMTMAQRIPELEAAPERRESPQPSSEEPYSTHAPPEAYGSPRGPEAQRKRSWWREFLGME